MYLYQSTILKNPSSFKRADGSNQLSAAEIAANEAAKIDFETNFKSLAVLVESVVISETTFVVGKTYTDFKALIVGDLTWADIKYSENNEAYNLNLAI